MSGGAPMATDGPPGSEGVFGVPRSLVLAGRITNADWSQGVGPAIRSRFPNGILY